MELVGMGRWKRLLTVAAAVALAGGATAGPGVSGSALAATDPGSFHVFGVSTTGNLYQDTWNGGWTAWQDLGNNGTLLQGTPAIAYDPSDNSYHAFALGTNGDTYENTYTTTAGWGDWQSLGGVLQGGLSAVYVGTSFHVFGVSSSGNLYQDTWNGSWTGWQDIGNDNEALTGSPGIAYDSSDSSYHAFALGKNGNTYQVTYTPSTGWGNWQNLGGVLQGGLSATLVGTSFHVFGVSSSGNLYQDTYSGGWTGYQDIGNDNEALTGAPGIAYDTSDGSYHAFALGANHNMYQVTYTASTGWGNWQNLGGSLEGGFNATYVPAAGTTSNCTADNNCTPQTFADAIFGYSGVNAPVTAANEFAFETWERAEGGGAGCPGQPANTAPWAYSAGPAGNPINAERDEPGSSNWNSAGVQIYANADGHTCWYWGVTANASVLLNGDYAAILNVLDHPSSSDDTQCVDLAQAVGDSPWGTPNFSADC
jgi:hypothetical protein